MNQRPSNHVIACLLLLAGLLAGNTCWATEVYRSVDENGNVVFSNEPPEGKKHKVIDVEVQNQLGAPTAPASETDYFRFNGSSSSRPPPPRYYKPKREKTDLGTLQRNCERYRNVGRRSEQQRERREYWCGRLHRGK